MVHLPDLKIAESLTRALAKFQVWKVDPVPAFFGKPFPRFFSFLLPRSTHSLSARHSSRTYQTT